MDAITITVRPNHFYDAAVEVWEECEAREWSRSRPLQLLASECRDDGPYFEPIPPRLSSMKMGHSAFCEARRSHAQNGLWAVDYCDGKGPREDERDLGRETFNKWVNTARWTWPDEEVATMLEQAAGALREGRW